MDISDQTKMPAIMQNTLRHAVISAASVVLGAGAASPERVAAAWATCARTVCRRDRKRSHEGRFAWLYADVQLILLWEVASMKLQRNRGIHPSKSSIPL